MGRERESGMSQHHAIACYERVRRARETQKGSGEVLRTAAQEEAGAEDYDAKGYVIVQRARGGCGGGLGQAFSRGTPHLARA